MASDFLVFAVTPMVAAIAERTAMATLRTMIQSTLFSFSIVIKFTAAKVRRFFHMAKFFFLSVLI